MSVWDLHSYLIFKLVWFTWKKWHDLSFGPFSEKRIFLVKLHSVLYCPVKRHSIEHFVCVDLLSECWQSTLFQIFCHCHGCKPGSIKRASAPAAFWRPGRWTGVVSSLYRCCHWLILTQCCPCYVLTARQSCPAVQDPFQGRYLVTAGNGFDHGSVVNFTCTNPLYELQGSANLLCQNGQWSDTFPTCERELDICKQNMFSPLCWKYCFSLAMKTR